MSSTIFFIHIPKTAGTALRSALMERMGISQVGFFDDLDTPSRIDAIGIRGHECEDKFFSFVSRPRVRPLLSKVRLVSGHMSVAPSLAMATNLPMRFSLLRNPYDRGLSKFRYLKDHPETPQSQEFARLGLDSIEDFVFKFNLPGIHNGVIRQVLGIMPIARVTEAHYHLARTVMSGFDYVGIQEKMDDVAKELPFALNLSDKSPLNIKTENASSYKMGDVSRGVREALTAKNKFDFMLYNHFLLRCRDEQPEDRR